MFTETDAKEQVVAWTEGLLRPYLKRLPTATAIQRAGKLVRDPVHGFHWLRPHEILVLDSPVVQRLRYIHQTGLAYVIYPSAQHTRFDHSLGVCKNATSMVEALSDTGRFMAPPEDRAVLRMAGLVHDVGHCLFSHLSEEIMCAQFEDLVTRLQNSLTFSGTGAGLHEMIGYWIVTSDVFGELLALASEVAGLNLDGKRITQLMVGRADQANQWQADIIHGPIDADRLDYIMRDSYFCGYRVDLDTDRFFYLSSVMDYPGAPRYLCLPVGGIPVVEQILFTRGLMYPAIYHHQKVRAAECLAKGIFEVLQTAKAPRHGKLQLGTIADFLNLSEAEFFVHGEETPAASRSVEALKYRDLPKRCLAISMHTVDQDTRPSSLADFETLKTKSPTEIADLRKKIYDRLPKEYKQGLHSLWIDIPPDPDFDRGAEHCLIDLEDGNMPQPLATLKGFNVQDWLECYELHKWHAHVFYVADGKAREAVAKAAEEVLEQDCDLVLNASAHAKAKYANT